MAMHAETPNWEAFHDYGPGAGTSPSASRGMLRTAGQTYVLLNIATGEELAAVVTAETEGGTPDDFGARGGAPGVASPAHLLFDGKVDLSNGGLPGVRQAVKLTLAFTGLDPAKRYTFCGFVSRGGNYNNRWSVHTLVANNIGVAAHKDGSANRNIFTAATFLPAAESLAANQVALNSGHNKEGSLVCWEQIEPMEDGSVRVESLRYMGPTPFGEAAHAGTSYAYGFEAFYLAEFEATGNLRITENPSNLKVPAGTKATFSVVASSPDPIQYQW
ncbi:MAG: hypothetical protein FJ405_07280, partial [Verrucomicrobia bacterium]|nr:hypothetical protein [Verrucomicrobiota bacterium]